MKEQSNLIEFYLKQQKEQIKNYVKIPIINQLSELQEKISQETRQSIYKTIEQIQWFEKQVIISNPFLACRLIYVIGDQIQFKELKIEVIGYLGIHRLDPNYRKRYIMERGLLKRQNLFKNFEFYFSGEGIQKILQMKGNYEELESNHDYIQLIFPNHYKSAFNPDAWPMDYYQVEIFKVNKQIGNKILSALTMFLDFMGLKLNEQEQIQIINEERLWLALIAHYHNNLRVRRILACLSITGFRHIAVNLINFLKKLIKEKSSFAELAYELNEFLLYSDHNEEKAKKMCFIVEKSFPPKHPIYQKKTVKQQKMDIPILTCCNSY